MIWGILAFQVRGSWGISEATGNLTLWESRSKWSRIETAGCALIPKAEGFESNIRLSEELYCADKDSQEASLIMST